MGLLWCLHQCYCLGAYLVRFVELLLDNGNGGNRREITYGLRVDNGIRKNRSITL